MAYKNNTSLSLCVDKVLDHVGASEQIRRNHVEKGLLGEVSSNLIDPILSNINGRRHNVGSWCEGTTTKGLNSDIDQLSYCVNYPAVEELPSGFEICCLIINDGTTKPGYVKLQLVYNGISITSDIYASNEITDQFGRICLCCGHPPFGRVHFNSVLDFKEEIRGPAFTLIGPDYSPELDQVYAYRCYSIPTFANGWIYRPRKYDWPSKQLLDKMSTYGCFLVRKGHPASRTEYLEWRISFSFQERELMFSLNSTQHKCYILLKMIKQYLVSNMNEKSISSYHLKTALFYTIENNPTHIWIPDNLVYCTELCLKQLLDWLNNENCPNFFVPEENMFDRLSSDVMKMTAKYIRDMLDSDGQYLMVLTCDEFGELLQESLSGKVLPNHSDDVIELDLTYKLYLSLRSSAMLKAIANLANRNRASDTLSELKLLLEELRQSEERLESEKLFREIKQCVNLLIPTIHLQIAQTIAAIMLTVTDADKKRELMQDFNHNLEQVNGFDVFSQILIKVSLLFKQNELEECERILTDCETLLKEDNFLSICQCTNTYGDYGIEKMIEKGNTPSMSVLEFHRNCTTSCLMFLPSQADLVPTPLHYEMYRSVGADTVDPNFHYWFGTIAIDAELYLLFLQYLNYSKLNKHDLAERAKLKLAMYFFGSIDEEGFVVHRETGLNLLGWIYKQEKDIESAMECFYLSWKIRPDHNAAKWHMLVMMYEQYVQNSKT